MLILLTDIALVRATEVLHTGAPRSEWDGRSDRHRMDLPRLLQAAL